MSIAVGIGLMDFPFSGARDFWRWVDVCEEGGLDSIWQTDRLVSRKPVLECMSTMAALSGATRKIKFGMNVLALGFRDPLVVAKECATIDMLSEGRLLPAFGSGSPSSPDWAATGRTEKGRGRRTDEALEIIARLWSGEDLHFEGEFFNYAGAHISPLPVQRKIPLWFGGSGPVSVTRTAQYGSGWLGGRETPEQAGKAMMAIRLAARDLGRRVPSDHFGASFGYRHGSPEEPVFHDYIDRLKQRFPKRDPSRSVVAGDADVVLARIADYAAAGISKFVLRPIGADDDDIIDQTKWLADEIIPRLGELSENIPELPPEVLETAT
ncbi:MAG: LLM class flavin-dependent oxidoreductase [Pseudomonadota bacterium]